MPRYARVTEISFILCFSSLSDAQGWITLDAIPVRSEAFGPGASRTT